MAQQVTTKLVIIDLPLNKHQEEHLLKNEISEAIIIDFISPMGENKKIALGIGYGIFKIKNITHEIINPETSQNQTE